MPVDLVLAFFVFAIAAAITPGPSNVMVMTAGVRAGLRGGLACLAGVVAGMSLLIALAAVGLGAIVKVLPWLLSMLRWGGAAFLLWLAWKVASAPPMRSSAPEHTIGFLDALMFQWVNPKSWIVATSTAGTFGAQADESAMLRAVVLACVFAAAAAPSCGVWLLFGASMKRWLTNQRRSRIFNITMGSALAASVLLVVL